MALCCPHPAAVAIVVTLSVASWGAVAEGRADSARERYEDALVLDREARALADGEGEGDAAAQATRVARRALALYESVVRRYPKSGYCDNALLRGGDLAQWLFTRFGRAGDRAAAVKYYDWLIREYPGSSMNREAVAAVGTLRTPDRGAVQTRATLTPAPDAPNPLPSPSPVSARAPAAAAEAPVAATAAPTGLPATTPSSPTGPPATARRPAVATASPTLRGIERTVVNGTVRVTLMLDREIAFSHEVLDGPPRAFVDLHGAAPTADLKDAALRYESGDVRQIRVGRRRGATRVVLDLDAAARVSVFTLYNPFRVIIDADRPGPGVTATVARATPAARTRAAVRPPVVLSAQLREDVPVPPRDETDVVPAAARVPPPDIDAPALHPLAVAPAYPAAARREALSAAAPVPPEALVPLTTPDAAMGSLPVSAPPPLTATRPGPVAAPPAGTVPLTASVPMAAALPLPDAEPVAPAPTVPAVNADGSFSLARQLGLGISRIVIDPGHGGHDPGTLTTGSNEARLVLDVALRLERLLQKEPGLEVVLTRRTDIFVPLEQRTAIANREGADLFLSIHANASRDRNARGVETYFLSFASNPEAEAVAARENATSASGMHNLPGIVRAIALNNKLDESRDLAGMVQQSLTARLSKTNAGLRSRGVKKAPFVVLIGAGMPSVLAEVGFLTNRQESGLVKTPAYRQRIAESLHAAVMQYRRALKRQSAVATR